MPNLPDRSCGFPNCPDTVTPPERYCPDHKPIMEKQDRERRGSASARGYSYRWQQEREAFLFHNPLCVKCEAEGTVEPATVVDHIIPHKGDPGLFWDKKNWQALCKPHHDEKTAREGGFGNVIEVAPAPQGGV